jgi:hypothetical protein
MPIWLTSRGRLQRGPAELSAGLRYTTSLGEQEGWRSVIHRKSRCDLSLFQLGLRVLEHFLNEGSLNLSEFVDGSSSSLGRELRFSETLLFSRDWPENGEERHSVSASIDELQIAIN